MTVLNVLKMTVLIQYEGGVSISGEHLSLFQRHEA